MFLFLLIPFTLKSQDGLTKGKKYWFTESQVQEMYRVKLDLEFFQLENNLFVEIDRLNDSTLLKYQLANQNLSLQLSNQEKKYESLEVINKQLGQKYRISENTITSLKTAKTVLIISTGVVVLGMVVAIFK